MMKKILLTIILIIIGTSTTANIVLANDELAGSLLDKIPCAYSLASGNNQDCNPCDFVQLFINGSDIIIGLSGAFAILMFIFGGLMMLTAYGNDARVQWGKDILLATVVGIFIVLFAWTIINLITLSLYGGNSGAMVSAIGGEWNGPCSTKLK